LFTAAGKQIYALPWPSFRRKEDVVCLVQQKWVDAGMVVMDGG
jgi:hypothetical protein